MKIFDNPNFDFVRWRWHAIALSLVVIIAGGVFIATRGLSTELRDQSLGLGPDLRQRPLLRLRLPFRGTIESVHVVGVMLPDGEHQLHVRFGDTVHGGGSLAGRCRLMSGAAGEQEQDRQQDGGAFHIGPGA